MSDGQSPWRVPLRLINRKPPLPASLQLWTLIIFPFQKWIKSTRDYGSLERVCMWKAATQLGPPDGADRGACPCKNETYLSNTCQQSKCQRKTFEIFASDPLKWSRLVSKWWTRWNFDLEHTSKQTAPQLFRCVPLTCLRHSTLPGESFILCELRFLPADQMDTTDHVLCPFDVHDSTDHGVRPDYSGFLLQGKCTSKHSERVVNNTMEFLVTYSLRSEMIQMFVFKDFLWMNQSRTCGGSDSDSVAALIQSRNIGGLNDPGPAGSFVLFRPFKLSWWPNDKKSSRAEWK